MVQFLAEVLHLKRSNLLNELELKRYDLSALGFVIVDDNDFDRRLILNILRSFNIVNVHSCDQANAISTIKQHPPEILVCDFSYPSKLGLKLTRYVRQPDSPINSAIAIIMTSSDSTADHINEARGAGIDQYLIKPLSPLVMYQNIVRCIESSRPLVHVDDYFGPDRRPRKPGKKPARQNERRKR